LFQVQQTRDLRNRRVLLVDDTWTSGGSINSAAATILNAGGLALRLAIRCARDSMPPLRLAIIDDVAQNPDSTAWDVRKRIDKPRTTVDRQMQALHMLGVLEVEEVEETNITGKPVTRWNYSLADGIEPTTLDPDQCPDLAVPANTDATDTDKADGSDTYSHSHTA
jgi:hypothetical protein